MLTRRENAFLVQALADRLDELERALGDSWGFCRELILVLQRRLLAAVDDDTVVEEVDALFEMLLATSAASLIRELMRSAQAGVDIPDASLRTRADRVPEIELIELTPAVSVLGNRLQLRKYEHFVTVPVFYATDRHCSSSGYYGRARGELHFGIAEVSIPGRHRIGEIERPHWWKLQFSEDPQRFVSVLRCDDVPRGLFGNELRKVLAKAADPNLLVFIHGYNVTFVEALEHAAQIAYDLDSPTPPVLYSWPSQGRPLAYTVDETNITWTQSHFLEFAEFLLGEVGASTVDMVSHSMGSRALAHGLVSFDGSTGKPPILRNLVFAAPDIDADVFRDILCRLATRCQRVTLYASSRDWALHASKLVHGYPRAGESGKGIVVVPNLMDTVDATAVSTSLLGHSYVGNNRSVLTDMFTLFRNGTPPPRFGMSRREEESLSYWVFRP